MNGHYYIEFVLISKSLHVRFKKCGKKEPYFLACENYSEGLLPHRVTLEVSLQYFSQLHVRQTQP